MIVSVLLALLFSGCTISDEAQLAIAQRQVSMTMYGLYASSPTGIVFGFGYLRYDRNLGMGPVVEPPQK